jgi:hypothetical protein
MDHSTEENDEELLITLKDHDFDISRTKTRFYMLFLACLLCIGSYFVYDNPAALETQLQKSNKNTELLIGNVKFNMLYSVLFFT